MIKNNKHPSSFRDPEGFVFSNDEGRIFRQIQKSYKKDYDHFIKSGLYDELLKKHLIQPHTEVDTSLAFSENAYKVLEYNHLEFISYPYEWSFGQYKDAALTTLEIQRISLKYGMTLKDATPYNIQFHQGNPCLIDTSSFEVLEEGAPWQAYHQFCETFLAPISLMSYCDLRLNSLMKHFINGIPLEVAISLLPFKAKFNFGLYMHIFIHAKYTKKYEGSSSGKPTDLSFSKYKFQALIDNLISTTDNCIIKKQNTEWGNYYQETNYTDTATQEKSQLLDKLLSEVSPKKVWDIGANCGTYSRVAAKKANFVLSCDIDPIAVEQNYQHTKKELEQNIHPLLLDVCNPSPAIGWANVERFSLTQGRHLPDLVMALALVHHLVISNNVPLERIAEFLSTLSEYLIIEFIPKTDSQVMHLLSTREDIFPQYNLKDFEKIFGEFYKIKSKEKIKGSKRVLFLMQRKVK
jgi:23S rRNA U2552 (ribose-2'-O)-methylase RlmE/FtsJ